MQPGARGLFAIQKHLIVVAHVFTLALSNKKMLPQPFVEGGMGTAPYWSAKVRRLDTVVIQFDGLVQLAEVWVRRD